MACDIDSSTLLSDESNSEVEERSHSECINLLLLGTSGNGKSASGNSITLQSSLKTSDSVRSQGKILEKCSSEFEGLVINVVEIPGNQSDDQSLENFEEFQELIEEALMGISVGFTAIIYVLKYGNRFTEQECRMMKWIKGIFGDKVVKNSLICLLTHGDFFECESEDEDKLKAFESWCKQQEGKIKTLFQECNYRCVLFNNKTKNPVEAKKQLKTLLELTHKTKVYTDDNYENAKECRQLLANEIKAPAIQKEAERKLNEFREILAQLESKEEFSPTEKLRQIDELLNQVKDFEKTESLSERPRNMIKMIKIEIMTKIKLIKSEERSKRLLKDNEISKSKRSRADNSKHRLISKGSTDSDESEKLFMQSSSDSEFDYKEDHKIINLLLLGTERNGKHLVKNILLGSSVSEHALRSWRDVEKSSAKFKSLTINVYDFPDSKNTFDEDLEMFQNYIKKSFRMCGDGFSALVLVLKYNGTIDQRTLRLLKVTFGQTVLQNNVICVVTGGDKLEKDYMGKLSLNDWCRAQSGTLKTLFQECRYRCTLFNDNFQNQEERAKQVRSLLALTEKVQMYTINDLKDASMMSIQNQFRERGRAIQFLFKILSGVLKLYTAEDDNVRDEMESLIEDVQANKYHDSEDPILRKNNLIKELEDVTRKLDESLDRTRRSDSRHGLELQRNTPVRESTRPLLNNNRENVNASGPTNKNCCACHIL